MCFGVILLFHFIVQFELLRNIGRLHLPANTTYPRDDLMVVLWVECFDPVTISRPVEHEGVAGSLDLVVSASLLLSFLYGTIHFAVHIDNRDIQA